MKNTSVQIIPIILTVLLTSAIWFLAVADGSIEIVKRHLKKDIEYQTLNDERNILKVETEILELKLKKRLYQAQLQYMESKGF